MLAAAGRRPSQLHLGVTPSLTLTFFSTRNSLRANRALHPLKNAPLHASCIRSRTFLQRQLQSLRIIRG